MSMSKGYLEIFKSTLDVISLNQGGLAKWMYQTVSKKHRDYVSRKYSGKVEVTSRDAVFIQILEILEIEGYDLASVEFDDTGKIIRFDKSINPS